MFTLFIAFIAAVALVALGVWAWRWNAGRSSGRNDRYMPEAILTSEKIQMLDYLQDTFPGRVVLPNVTLQSMLSVRRAADPKRAEKRLHNHRVDFVVCGEDGRPSFAFDIEQYHLSNAKAKMHWVKMKNRILKTAGVRFVLLKNGLHRMPSPADFRKQLDLAALPQPKARATAHESALQQLETQFSAYHQIDTTSGQRDSEIMGLSKLMDCEPHDRHKAHSEAANSAYGDSRYDSRSNDLRGR
jgi:Protein of unknown function (DUF2726)